MKSKRFQLLSLAILIFTFSFNLPVHSRITCCMEVQEDTPSVGDNTTNDSSDDVAIDDVFDDGGSETSESSDSQESDDRPTRGINAAQNEYAHVQELKSRIRREFNFRRQPDEFPHIQPYFRALAGSLNLHNNIFGKTWLLPVADNL